MKKSCLNGVGIIAFVAVVAFAAIAQEGTPGIIVPTPIEAPIHIDSHGTERLRCESGWFRSPGEAERDCDRKLDTETRSVEARLRREGKEVIGHQTFPARCEIRSTSSGDTQYRCTRRYEINWNRSRESVKEAVFDLSSTLSSAISASNNKSNAVELIALQQVSAPQGSYVIIEDDLLAKFKRAHNGGYETMTLKNVVIPASNVRVGQRLSSLPNTVVEDNYVVINQTPATQSRRVRLTLEETVGETYAFSREVVSRSSTTDNLSVTVSGIPLGGGGATGGGTAGTESTTERSISLRNETGKTYTRRNSRDEEFDVSVPGNSALYIKAQRVTYNTIYALEGSALFDGTVTVGWTRKEMVPCGLFKTDRCPKYHSESRDINLSQLVSVQDRTYDMSGRVTLASNNASETRLMYGTKPIDEATVDLTDPNGQKQDFLPERDYYKIETVPADIIYRDTQTRRCGFWIFTYECRN